MAIQIISGGSVDLLTIDPVSNAARTTLYDSGGVELAKTDHANGTIIPGTTKGLLIGGADYRTPLALRCSSDGSALFGDRILLLHDRFDVNAGTTYNTVNTNKWIYTFNTMTIAPISTSSVSALVFNSGSSVTINQGAQLTSHRYMPVMSRSTLKFRCRMQHGTHYNNNVIEMGFGSPTTANAYTGSVVNGACWRKDASGNYTPVLSVANNEKLGTPIPNSTFIASIPVTSFAIFEVHVTNNCVFFFIYKTTGELAFSQSMDFNTTGNVSSGFQQTRLQAMVRMYNSGGTGTAVQATLDDVSVWMMDIQAGKPWNEQLAGDAMDLQNVQVGIATTGHIGPDQYGNTVPGTNNTGPTVATPTNTTIALASLGGQTQWSNGANSFASSETSDWLIFSYLVPSPFGLMVKGIHIDSVNMGATSNAAIYVIEWTLHVNGTAVSLVTGSSYRHKVLGYQTLAGSSTAGTAFAPAIDVRFQTGFYVYPANYIALSARVIAGSVATGSQQIRTDMFLDGYWE